MNTMRKITRVYSLALALSAINSCTDIPIISLHEVRIQQPTTKVREGDVVTLTAILEVNEEYDRGDDKFTASLPNDAEAEGAFIYSSDDSCKSPPSGSISAIKKGWYLCAEVTFNALEKSPISISSKQGVVEFTINSDNSDQVIGSTTTNNNSTSSLTFSLVGIKAPFWYSFRPGDQMRFWVSFKASQEIPAGTVVAYEILNEVNATVKQWKMGTLDPSSSDPSIWVSTNSEQEAGGAIEVLYHSTATLEVPPTLTFVISVLGKKSPEIKVIFPICVPTQSLDSCPAKLL